MGVPHTVSLIQFESEQLVAASPSSLVPPSKLLTSSDKSSSSLLAPPSDLWEALFDRAATPDRETRPSPSTDNLTPNSRRGLATSAEYKRAISQLEKELSELQLKTECGICFEEGIAVTFAPCGHRFVCNSCSKALNASGHAVRCPLCRAEVTAFLNSYTELAEEGGAQTYWTCPSCTGTTNNSCFVCEGVASFIDPGSLEFLEETLKETRKNLFFSKQHLHELRDSVSQVLASQFPPPPVSESLPQTSDSLTIYETQLSKLLEQVASFHHRQECQNCHAQHATVTFFPCGHHTSCKSCARTSKVCPSCGKPIQNLIVTYQA